MSFECNYGNILLLIENILIKLDEAFNDRKDASSIQTQFIKESNGLQLNGEFFSIKLLIVTIKFVSLDSFKIHVYVMIFIQFINID